MPTASTEKRGTPETNMDRSTHRANRPGLVLPITVGSEKDTRSPSRRAAMRGLKVMPKARTERNT